jgi:hypothetical protein
VVTIVQLIALFYKDQHVENMQKLLGTWINPTTSESSEDDDESNTSPPVSDSSGKKKRNPVAELIRSLVYILSLLISLQIGPCNSPQILTSSSDPTSDSSDSAQRKASALAPQGRDD